MQAALEKAGGGEGVMIGDSTWDCLAAGRAGIETLAVLTGGFSEAELREAGATAVFGSVQELRHAARGDAALLSATMSDSLKARVSVSPASRRAQST